VIQEESGNGLWPAVTIAGELEASVVERGVISGLGDEDSAAGIIWGDGLATVIRITGTLKESAKRAPR
jgi:hypothetical protein